MRASITSILRTCRWGCCEGAIFAGTLLANMLAVTAASGLPSEIVPGFVDDEVNRLLDLDTRREVSLCLVPIGRISSGSLPGPTDTPTLDLKTIPLSQREVEYPVMLEMHGASSLTSAQEVAQWRARGKQAAASSSAAAGEELRLQPLRQED